MIPYFPSFSIEINLPIVGVIEVQAFGIFATVAFFVAISVSEHKSKLLNLNSGKMLNIYVLIVVGTIFGGHLGYLLMYNPDLLVNNPLTIFDLSYGLSSFGGFISCLILCKIYCWRSRISFMKYFEPVLFSFPAGWAIARLGCVANHEHLGTETTSILGRYCVPVEEATIVFPSIMKIQPGDLRFGACKNTGEIITNIYNQVQPSAPNAIIVHDMSIYEIIYALIICIIFYGFRNIRNSNKTYLAVLVATYSPLRFFLDFWRVTEDNPRYLMLTPAQWLCLGGIIFMFIYLGKIYKANGSKSVFRN